MNICVTGAAGFVGRAAVDAALAHGHQPVAVVRRTPEHGFPTGVEVRAVGDLIDAGARAAAVKGCEAVVHLAARVRVEKGERAREAELMRRDNALLTGDLAEAAAAAGSRRFVFLSSLKVYGSTTPKGATLTDASPTAPHGPYGESKLEAERRLAEVAARTGMSAISLRPPAVFGPGQSASQLRLLMRAVQRGVPLPLGGVRNRRSFVYSGNLADALVAACESDATGAFVLTDSDPISSAGLAAAVAHAVGLKARLLPTPAGLARLGAKLIGKGEMGDSLYGSMAADGRGFGEATGWRPAVDRTEAMALTVADLDRAQKGLSPSQQRR